jgi:hypothetical protein
VEVEERGGDMIEKQRKELTKERKKSSEREK